MSPYLKTSLRWFAFAAIIAALWMFYGCAPTSKTLFNEYHSAHLYETRPTDKSIDVLVTVRIRAFGSKEEKRKAWCQSWPSFCKPGYPAAGMSVSSKVPEIWIDLRENSSGLVINDVVIGHEIQHTLKLYDSRVHDPDR
jgi:hypothetical protein